MRRGVQHEGHRRSCEYRASRVCIDRFQDGAEGGQDCGEIVEGDRGAERAGESPSESQGGHGSGAGSSAGAGNAQNHTCSGRQAGNQQAGNRQARKR